MSPLWTIFDNMEQCTKEEVQRLLGVVSSQRREQALRIKHLSGRYACLKSYEMLMELIDRMAPGPTWQFSTKWLQVPPGNYQLNEHGKPYFPQCPDLHFNISHCKHAIAVIVDSQPVGIDVERYVNPTPSLLRYTMNDEEVALVEGSEHPEQTFAMLWTQKEALFKLYGTGITDDVRQLLTHPRPSVTLTTTFNIDKGYCYTLAYSVSSMQTKNI